SWSILRDSAESDLRASDAGAVSAERRPKEPKLPDGFDVDDDDDDFEDSDECCDENPPLNDAPDGLASTGADASDSVRDSANTTCAYVEMVFSMVRSAVES
ncbi:MAG: hypothetical protein WCC39_12260, partial [Telluria sp.]